MPGLTRKPTTLWPLVVLAAAILISLIIAANLLAAEVDKVAAQREQSLVENGIRDRINEVAHLADGQAVWDDAVRHLDNHFDKVWAQDNTGTVPCQIYGFDDTFILDANDKPVLAANKNGSTSLESYMPFEKSTAALIKKVRITEAKNRSSINSPHSDRMVNSVNVNSTLTSVEGSVYIMSTMQVEPDLGRATLRGSHAPIIVTAMRIDERFASVLSKRFLVNQIHFDTKGPSTRRPVAFVIMRSDVGKYVAELSWSPQTPGNTLLRRVGPSIFSILILLTLGILGLYRRAQLIANNLIASEARATHLAYYDALTGLPNRVLFYDRLAHALGQTRRAGEMLAVYFLDLDDFKSVNDTYGHHVGDELIQKVSKILIATCDGKDIVARLSGDEFAIVQMLASTATATRLATQLNSALREPLALDLGTVFIGCSIGITLVSDYNLQPDEIVRRADVALYRSKATAKGHFCLFEPEMDTKIKLRRAMEADLRTALAEGTLYMVYQPQFNRHQEITGVEALMRWKHAKLGNISPIVFVSIAEECGLIVELGTFALRQAFEASKRWKHIKVAINISAKQLRMKDFVTKLMELVEETNVHPEDFELEITEGTLLGDDPDTHLMLCQLREHGFELALDDFGTGYSSLSYLKRYPINRIKIDQSFIAGLGASHEAEAFIVAIVRLAQALRLSVIAEGVETSLQQRMLILAGCTDMQGYLFSKPISADEVDLLLSLPRNAGHRILADTRSLSSLRV